MSMTAMALLGLLLWSVALTFVLLFVRIGAVRRGEKAMNAFQADGKDLDAAGLRITRAHANSIEYLACAAAPMLLAVATGMTVVTDPLAGVVLLARVGQSTVHMISTAPGAVMLRATLFSVQVFIWVWWSIALVRAA